MRHALRLGIVVAAAVVALASACGPSRHAVQAEMTMTESHADTWAALLELFAEKRWATKHAHEKSGLLTTDWIELGYDGDKYADCGNAPLLAKPSTQVELEIRVTRTKASSVVRVSSTFRRQRTDRTGFIDCSSRGSIETTIHNEVAARANKRAMARGTPPPTRPVPEAPGGFYCAGSPGNPSVSICARRQADCESGRAAVVAAVPDITTCVRVEQTWCFDAGSGAVDQRCSATSESCEAQRSAAQGSAALPECAERR